MIEFITSITPQEWALLGSCVAAFVGSIITVITSKKGQNVNTKQNTTLTNMTGGIIDVLSKVKDASDSVNEIIGASVSKIDEALTAFKTGLTENHEQNLAVAAFILECFNQSNLSDDKKAKLQLMFDQMFYTDKTDLINKLQDAKLNAETMQTKLLEANAQLENKVADLEEQLANATATTKKARRI